MDLAPLEGPKDGFPDRSGTCIGLHRFWRADSRLVVRVVLPACAPETRSPSVQTGRERGAPANAE